ncbi:MAG: hypothetical protein WCZ89_08530, partial [Phycisphaerae bacterium]
MSKSPSKKNQSKKTNTVCIKDDKLNLLAAVIVTLAAGGFFFGLGKYFEFNSPGAFDSGAYVYSAARVLDGAEIG